MKASKRILPGVVLVFCVILMSGARLLAEDVRGVPVRFWGGGGAAYNWEGAPGGFIMSISGLESAPGAANGYKYLWGTEYGPNGFLCTVSGRTHETAYLEPGKRYDIDLSGSWVSAANVGFAAPPGYRVEINGIIRNIYEEIVSMPEEYFGTSMTLRILGPVTDFSGPAGKASDLSEGKLFWQVAMGDLLSGRSAGALTLVDAGTSSSWTSVFSPAGLHYEAPSSEVSVYRNSGVIRQVIAPATVVDVVTSAQDSSLSSTQYELRFYNPAHVAGSSFPRTFTDQPFVTYRIEQGGTATTLKLTSTTRQLEESGRPVKRIALTSIARSGTWPAFTWTRNNWNTKDETQLTQTIVVSGGSTTARTEAVTNSASNSSTATVIARTFAAKAWGEVLTEVNLGSSYAIESDYDYYDSVSESGRYGFLKQVTRNGGEWESYDYWTSTNPNSETGVLKYRYRPVNGSPSSVSFNAAQGDVTYYEYALDPFGMKTRVSLVENRIDNVLVRRASTTYSNISGTINGLYVVEATRQDRTTSNTSDYLTTVTRYYREDTADAFFRHQLHSQTSPDFVKTAYAYQRGTWSSGTFTKSGSAGLGAGTASRIAVITGTTNSGAGTSFTAYDDYDIDDLYLVAGKSTMQVTIRDARALVVRTEAHVWTGSVWALVGSSSNTYSLNGSLTQSQESNGAVYSAEYAGDQKVSDKTAAGVEILYEYDHGGRIQSITKKEGGPLFSPIITSFDYNANGQIINETRSSADTYTSETIVNSQTYDNAGRLATQTPAGLSATTFTYSPATRSQTSTAPSGATVTQTTQLDGRLYSTTGTGVIPQYYSYGVEADGRRWTQVNQGSSSSPRYSKVWVDWIGRAIKSLRPGYSKSSQADFVEEKFYDDATIGKGRLYKITKNGSAPLRYEYDVLGGVIRLGLDVNNNGLDPASNDRIADTDTLFDQRGGSNWWIKSITKSYPTFGSASPVITTSTMYKRLTGFSGGVQDEVETIDAEGNSASTKTIVTRGSKLVVTSTVRSGFTNAATVDNSNGFNVAFTGHDALIQYLEHDPLGRPSMDYDTRNNTKTTNYVYGTELVASVQDEASQFVQQLSYDASGRVLSSTDVLGNVTYFAYNSRNQIIRQWGSASYPVEYGYDSTYGDRLSVTTYQSGSGWGGNAWPSSPGTGNITSWDYDPASGQLWRKTDAATKVATYDYNASGRVYTKLLARGVSTAYTYDSATGELTKQDYSDSTTDVEYTYNRFGGVESVTDATGLWDYHYDSSKPWRSTGATLPSLYGTRSWSNLYQSGSPVGRYYGFQLLDTTSGTVCDLEETYSYGGSGRLDSITSKRTNNSVSRTFEYGYESDAPWVNSLTISGGHAYAISKTYDATRPLLASIDSTWSATSVARVEYGYNTIGQRRTARLSGDAFSDYYTGQSYGAITRYHDYNGRGELLSEAAFRGDPASGTPSSSDQLPGRRMEYRYDNLGNRLTSGATGSSGGGDDVYVVNPLNQYESRQNNRIWFHGTADAAATVAVTGATTGKLDRTWAADFAPANSTDAVKSSTTVSTTLSGVTTTQSRDYFVPKRAQTFAYDDDGNLLHDSVWNYTWDAENRLIAMQHRSEVIGTGKIASGDALRLEFRYDYIGRRVNKKVLKGWNGTTYTTWDSETRFIYDGWNLVAEWNVSSAGVITTLKRSYTWGLDVAGSRTASGGVGALLQIHDYGSNTTLLPSYDGNGNVIALVDASSSTLSVQASYEYSAFGETLRAEGAYAQTNPFRFSTKYTDSESGLIYYGHRYYSASLGRFINRDPIEESGGLNLYGFCGNDGVGRIDLLGMDTMFVDGSAGFDGGVNPPKGQSIWDKFNNRDTSDLPDGFDVRAIPDMGSITPGRNRMNERALTNYIDSLRVAERQSGYVRIGQMTNSDDGTFVPNAGDGTPNNSNVPFYLRRNAPNSGVEMSYGTGREDKMPPPEGLLDERGYKYSKVWILQNGSKVSMYVPVIYKGAGATAQNIDAYEKGIRQAWEGKIGKYEVDITFMRGGHNPSGKILYGTYVYMAEAGQSRSWFYSGNGMMVVNTLDMGDAAPHEFGHLMWNTLHYDRPHEGYENNIMVRRGGGVEEINITDAINKWGGWYSSGFKPPGTP